MNTEKSLEDKIIELRSQGKSYREIEQVLTCSRGTISYFLNKEVKARTMERQRAKRAGVPLEPLRRSAEPKPDKPIKRQLPKPHKMCEGCGDKLTDEQVSWGSVFCSLTCYGKYREEQNYNLWLNGCLIIRKNSTLRKFLARANGDNCSVCKIVSWENKPITLEVDHLDGNSENNNIDNLRLICPNCHSQTDTYKGKNLGNGRHARRMRYREGKSY